MRWFLGGFVGGALLLPVLLFFKLEEVCLPLLIPAFLAVRVNPAIWLLCDVLHRDALCVGLGFDGGPLEPLEHAWVYLSLGLMYGTLALLARYAVGVCCRSLTRGES